MKKYKLTINDKFLSKVFSEAIFECKESNRKKGIPNAFVSNNKIYFEMPNGTITDIDPFSNN